jgi:hypothetical protein
VTVHLDDEHAVQQASSPTPDDAVVHLRQTAIGTIFGKNVNKCIEIGPRGSVEYTYTVFRLLAIGYWRSATCSRTIDERQSIE